MTVTEEKNIFFFNIFHVTKPCIIYNNNLYSVLVNEFNTGMLFIIYKYTRIYFHVQENMCPR